MFGLVARRRMRDMTKDIVEKRQQTHKDRDPETFESNSLTRSAGRGAMWQFVGAGWQTIVQLGASMVLARVLFPEDFGIMGMAVLAQGLVKRTGDLSPVSGVIAKKDVTQQDLSTAFWMGCAVQGLLFVVTFAMAPLAALFFETPEITWVIRALSATFLFTGIRAVHAAQLRKRLKFGALKIIEGAGFTLQSGLAILFVVVFNMNYWALVISMLAASFMETCSVILYNRWIPSFRFSMSSFRYLFRFAINGLGSSLTGYFRHNIDYLLVGKLLGPSTLGLYEFAYRIPHMALNRLAVPVSRVIFPTLSNMQANNERLAAGYIKTARYMAIVLFPALGGLAAVAEPAVAVLWGEKWLPVIVPLQILCFRSAIQSVVSPVSAIFLCKDRPDIPFKFDLYALFFTCFAVFGLAYAFGLVGVALGMLVSVTPSVVLLWLAFRLTDSPLKRFFFALAPPAIAATISSLFALVAVHLTMLWGGGNLIALGFGVLTGVSSYLVVMWLGFGDTTREVFQTVRIVFEHRGRQQASSQGNQTMEPEKQPAA